MTPFQRAVCRAVRRIPRGRVASYGDVAALLGRPGAGRAVGSALSALPDGARLPWWRVVGGSGAITTSRITRTAQVQRALLEAEGVAFGGDGRIPMERFRWRGGRGRAGSGRGAPDPDG